jgi:hypothetical protein
MFIKTKESVLVWRRIANIGLVVAAIAFSHPVQASGSVNGTISNVAGDYSNGMLIRLSGTFANPDNCARTDWYILPDNHPHSQLIQAIFLSSQAGNRSVGVQIDGCVDNFPKIVSAWN